MTTLKPREPYTDAELATLYPAGLELQQVQVLLRHGERTPVSARFKNAGLPAYWPYCHAADQFRSVVRAGASWDTLQWRRVLQTLGQDDEPKIAASSRHETNAICQPGELTDQGRDSTLALGQRMRTLYVDQLGFLPSTLASTPDVRLRSTPIQRALESVQQTFLGLYSPSQRLPSLPLPVIITRSMQDETLFPNEGACKRFRQLAHAFADRAATLYNESPEMAYINKRVGKWMPPVLGSEDGKPQPVRVDSHPRLSGLMDTINATLAHGPETKLPAEFYDTQLRSSIDRICTEEWFAGYQELNEYRKLGIGALIGDITQAMAEHAIDRPSDEPFKLSLSGCHDTTIAASLTALGCFDVSKDKWPPYTSSIAFELFKKGKNEAAGHISTQTTQQSWLSSWFSPRSAGVPARSPLTQWPEQERQKLEGYYVRIRYNDQPMTVPFCKRDGRHLPGDESLCTLAAFKEASDSFTPQNWKAECSQGLESAAIKADVEKPPGVQ